MRVLLALLLLSSACASSGPPATEGALIPQRMEAQRAEGLDYYLYLPRGYETRDDWPLVLFLHGGGESGTDLEKVKAHGPPALIDQGRDFPFVLLAPQNPYPARMWDDAALGMLLDETLPTLRVDPDRVVVTGLSRGAMATWRLGMQQPERFAGLVPIAGGGEPVYALRLVGVPVWAFYGAGDEAVALDDARRVADRLAEAGGAVTITVYEDAGHAETWERAYADPALYDWIETRRRRAERGEP